MLKAKVEDDLLQLYKFHMETKKYNMEISTEKRESMTIAKESVQHKLKVVEEMIDIMM